MSSSDVPTTKERVRSVLLRNAPERADDRISLARSDGSAYVVGTDLIARVGQARGQAAVLNAVAERSTLPVPVPLFVDADLDVLVYRRIEGVPLPNTEITAFGARLGAFLSRLHNTYVGTVDRVLPAGPSALDDPAARLDAAHERRSRLRPELSAAARALLERQVALPAPTQGMRRTVCHLDLSAPHLLMSPSTGEMSGVLGWGRAAIADPARDFAVVLTDLGPNLYDALAAGYRGPPDVGMHERAALFARCLLLERIELGLVSDDRAAAKDALRRLQHLG